MRTLIRRAATAGTTNASTTSGNASGSVCPKGWTLPSGGGSGDYANLITTTYGIPSDNDMELRNIPLNFNYNGTYDYSSGNLSWTSYGYYWSSTAYALARAYRLYFGSNVVNPLNDVFRGDGQALRCVAR